MDQVEKLLVEGLDKLGPWIITPYHWPDIDGIACTVALEELLKRLGYCQATAMIWQTPQIEAAWAIKELGFQIPQLSLAGSENIILVDASDPADIPAFVNPAQIKIVIDHRVYHRLDCFPNATAQIEAIGAAATMITEYFQHQSMIPSIPTATALYAGIASNTINFKASNTTNKDISAAAWLSGLIESAENFVRRMFLAKSDFTDLDMRTVIDRDLATKPQNIGGKLVAIAQLEVMGAEALIRGRFDEIVSCLADLKVSRNAECIFLMALDLTEGQTLFVFLDPKDREMLTPILNLSTTEGISKSAQIITRKELIAMLQR